MKEVEEIDLEIDSGEFFIKISDILRKYFQNNFYIISFEMTSAELKEFFNDKDLNNLLDRIDQVKFAQKTSIKRRKRRYFKIVEKSYKKTSLKQLIHLIYKYEYYS